MDFLGLIINGLVTVLLVMGILYIALHNPGQVAAVAIVAVVGSILFLVRS